MLSTPKCYERHCKNYLGVIQSDGTELTETNYCKAFPDGIPNDIAYGDNKHTGAIVGQENSFVFEKGKFEWED